MEGVADGDATAHVGPTLSAGDGRQRGGLRNVADGAPLARRLSNDLRLTRYSSPAAILRRVGMWQGEGRGPVCDSGPRLGPGSPEATTLHVGMSSSRCAARVSAL